MATTFTLRRKTYSDVLDSTPLVVDEIDYLNYLEKIYSNNIYQIKDDDLIDLDNKLIKSKAGRKTSMLGLVGGVAGRHAGIKHADKLIKENPQISDDELQRRAGKRAARVGGAWGAGTAGAAVGGTLIGMGAKNVPAIAAATLLGAGVGAGLGAVAGRAGTKKNIKDRINQRDSINANLIRSKIKNMKNSLDRKEFSEIKDQDYEDTIRKRGISKAGSILAGTTIGGSLGLSAGALFPSSRAIKAGALIGAAGGAYVGKKLYDKQKKKIEEKLKRYKEASEEDKEYLRNKLLREVAADEAQSNAIIAGTLAGRHNN